MRRDAESDRRCRPCPVTPCQPSDGTAPPAHWNEFHWPAFHCVPPACTDTTFTAGSDVS